MNSEKKVLEDVKINIKIKLSALWTSLMFCFVYGDYFELYVPEKVDSLISGANVLDSPTKLLIASVILAIPALMIALSILLSPQISRWLNIVFGIFYMLMMLFIAVNSLTVWYSFYVFFAILESAVAATIVWYAWKWRRGIAK